MELYFFVLGNHPAISIAEINTFAQQEGLFHDIVFVSQTICILQTEQKIPTAQWQRRLGGTIKIGKILDTASFRELTALNCAQWSAPFFTKEKKNTLGISLYTDDNSHFSLPKNFALTVKSALKKQEFSIRVLENKTLALSSVQVGTQNLLTKGLELVLIATEEKVYIGKTESIQDYEKYGERDFGRPNRDDRSGMLPPKLARMMLNLGQVRADTVLLDPFCGSGTIVTEAMDLGVRTLHASDISENAIQNTKKNVAWFSQYLPNKENIIATILQHDATKPFTFSKADLVVSELYLGPPTTPKGEALAETKKEIATLFFHALQSVAAMEIPPRKIVVAIPRFMVDNTWNEIDISYLEKTGYYLEQPLPDTLQNYFTDSLSSRGNLVYARPTASVGREILQLSLRETQGAQHLQKQ